MLSLGGKEGTVKVGTFQQITVSRKGQGRRRFRAEDRIILIQRDGMMSAGRTAVKSKGGGTVRIALAYGIRVLGIYRGNKSWSQM